MNRILFCVLPALLGSSAFAATPPRASDASANRNAQAATNTPTPGAQTLPNGATLVLRPDRLAPRIAISLLVRAGAADETPQTVGWRRLLGEAMLRATSNVTPNSPALSATALSREAERLGGRIGVSVGDDAVEIFVTGNSESARELALLAWSVALRPRLSEADVNAAKRRVEQTADAQEAVAIRASQSLEGQLFRDSGGQAVAYGLASLRASDAFAALSPDKLRELHAKFFKPSRMVVGVAGDVDAGALRDVFGAGEAGEADTSGAQPTFARPGKEPPLIVKQLPTATPDNPDAPAYVVVGFAGARAASPEAAALRVALAALTDSRLARLPKRLLKADLPLRGAGASLLQGQWSPRRFGSELALFAQTGTTNVDATKNALLDEVRRLRETPLTPQELQAARDYARGADATDREGLRERAYNAALWPLLGGSDAQWSALLGRVSALEVQRASAKYLDAYAVALVMPDDDGLSTEPDDNATP